MELTEVQQHEIHCHGAYVGNKTKFYCENKSKIKPLLIFFSAFEAFNDLLLLLPSEYNYCM